MFLRLYIIIFFGCTLCFPGLYAQQKNWLRETFGTRDGLLSPKIYSLSQATNGLLWIGTELGVSYYNGYEFHNHQYTRHNDIIGRVLAIAQDSMQGIWAGGDNGLFYFRENDFVKVNLPCGRALAVEALLTDTHGNLWIADIDALFRLDAPLLKKYAANDVSLKNISPIGGFTKRAFALTMDKLHNVYTGGFDAVYRFRGGEGSFETVCANPDPMHPIRTIMALSPDSLFWSRFQDSPEQYIEHSLEKISGTPQIGRHVFHYKGSPMALTTTNVSSFEKDKTLKPFFAYDSITRQGSVALADAEGNIWLGTWEGLHKFRETAFIQHEISDADNKEIFSMLETKRGELLFGGNRGKVFVKTEKGVVRHPAIPALFPLAEVLSMTEAKDGALWAGSGYQGISRYHQNSIIRYERHKFLKDNNCEMIFPDENGLFYACTEYGVSVIDPIKPQHFIGHYPFQQAFVRSPELFGGIQLQDGHTWFYGSLGLYRLHHDTLIIDSIQGLPTVKLYINKIIRDSRNNIWIATLGKGLIQCKQEGNKLLLINIFDQSRLPTANALSVLEDNRGNIWCADYMSLSRIHNNSGAYEIESFFEKDGLLNAYYPNLKLEKQKNGTLWMMTSMGLLSFNPDDIRINKVAPFLNFERIVVYDPDQTTVKKISDKTHASLPYNENSLTFSYTAVSLTNPSNIRYAYRLLGSFSNWQYTNGRSIDFRNLKPGKYNFQLLACNNNGIWVKQPLEYPFEIRRPYWQTNWFIGIVVLLIVSLVTFLIKRQIAGIKNKAAIQQQLAELEARAIRAQMNPHFIFNSLNAIQESIVMHDYETAYQYLSKFSKLLRMVLVHSEENLILLRDEIEMNRLYIELESMRFRRSFHYKIEVDEELDMNTILFPSIMVQPFIENAVWHGLLPKDGEKFLIVSYFEKDGDLVCTIDDNGIGREKAAVIKKQKLGARFFESKAMGLVKQRIKLFEKTGTIHADLEIKDKKDEAGHAEGTTVIIRVPLIFTKNQLV